MKVQEIASMIMIRDFIQRTINGIDVKMNSAEVRSLRDKLGQMDQAILQHLLTFDLQEVQSGNKKISKSE